MSNWQTVKLGDCTEIARGSSPRPINDNAYFDKGTIPWVKIADATASFKYIYETKEYVNEYGASYSRKLPPGSLIVAASGTLGFAIFLGVEGCVHDGWMYFKRIDEGKLHKQFLYYLLNTLTKSFNAFSYGAAIQNINTDILRNTEFRIPTLIVQKRIAAILSTYDELIENNQRRIALLEKMAEEIYREWFVRMRFPGHEKVKKIKGVPEGWCVAELKELASINPSSINRQGNPESILYVDISSVSTNRIDDVTPYISANAPGRARRRVKHGDIIWSSVRPANRAYCLIYEPPENLIVSTGFAVIRPNSATPFTFLFFAVTSNPFVDQMTTVAKGAAYPATSFDDFEKAKLLVPTEDLLRTFHEKTEPMFRQRHFLQQQSERLRKTRDMLLPRLISGKLSVEHLDIQFPPGMEESAHAN